MPKTLLMVAHCPSDNTRKLWNAVSEGVNNLGLHNIIFKALSPFETSAQDVLNADAIILGTPENLGYMSGALKDFFDRCYYPVLGEIEGRPYAAMICAGSDGQNAKMQLERIATGWRLKRVMADLLAFSLKIRTLR